MYGFFVDRFIFVFVFSRYAIRGKVRLLGFCKGGEFEDLEIYESGFVGVLWGFCWVSVGMFFWIV